MKRNLSIAIFLMYVCTAVQAYVFTDDFEKGFYWASFPITMNKFTTKVSDGVLLSSLMMDAEDEWEAAVGMPIWSIPDDAVISDVHKGNHIRWADDFAAETGFDPLTTLAVTIRYRSGTYITKTEIILNAEYGNLQTNNSKLKKVILHEMGHTFGLGHTQAYGVMRATIEYAASYLTDDDIAGAIAVMEETIWRQETNYVSPYAEDGGTCGTVTTVDSSSQGGGPGSFLLSFGLGLMAIALMRRPQFMRISIKN